MFVPEELKINKFKAVRIPSNEQYFSRFGQGLPTSGQFSGEDETLPIGQNKTEMLADQMEMYEEYARTSHADE